MKTLDWTFQEFKTYVLLYAAHCNNFESKEEEAYITSKVDDVTFHKIHTEVVIDADDEKLTKIQLFISENNLTQEQKEEVLREVKEVFFADGTVDVNEKNGFEELKRILL